MTCAVQVQVETQSLINLQSTLYVQSGLKYNNLCGKCPERIHYSTLHRVTRQQQF